MCFHLKCLFDCILEESNWPNILTVYCTNSLSYAIFCLPYSLVDCWGFSMYYVTYEQKLHYFSSLKLCAFPFLIALASNKILTKNDIKGASLTCPYFSRNTSIFNTLHMGYLADSLFKAEETSSYSLYNEFSSMSRSLRSNSFYRFFLTRQQNLSL